MHPYHYKAKLASLLVQTIDLVLFLFIFLGTGAYSGTGHPLALATLSTLKLTIGHYVGLLLAVLVCHFIFLVLRQYDFRLLEKKAYKYIRLALACTLDAGVLAIACRVLDFAVVDRTFLFLLWTTTMVVFFLWRLVIFLLLFLVRSMGRNLRQVVIVGLNDRSRKLANSITRKASGYHVLGFIDDAPPHPTSKHTDGMTFLCTLDRFEKYVSQKPVDQVILALPIRSNYDTINMIIDVCAAQGIQTWLLTDLFDLPGSTAFRVDTVENIPFLNYYTDPRTDIQYDVKRIFDFVSSLSAIILLSPLLFFIAFLILLSDGPPSVFSQTRIGLNKRRFKVYKFRTMVRDAEKRQADLEKQNEVQGPAFKIQDDPRVTPLGRFLRKTSLDELPQLFNVLFGQMSLVGPRPLPERDFEQFYDDRHRLRFSVKPGITGLWQISGRSDVDFEEWMKLDTFYVNNWSFLLDVNILVRTVMVVATMRGAY